MRHLVLVAVAALAGVAGAALPAEAAVGEPAATVAAEPSTVRFGDGFVLRVEVRIVGGEGAVVIVDPTPLTPLSPATTARRQDGDSTVVTATQRVACLTAACLSAGRTRTITAGRVSVRVGEKTSVVAVEPARITVTGRVDPALAKRSAGGYLTDTSVPAPTYPIAPGVLVALLVALTAVALLTALALLWPDARHRLAARAAAVDVDARARALRLLRESAGRAAPDRRRAADLVARLVGSRGDPRHAQSATRLAWSRPEPAPADAVGLADTLEREEGAS